MSETEASDLDPTLALHDSLSLISKPGKPGRKVREMGYGNKSGKRQKGIYLSRVACDMIDQLSIVSGKTDSNCVEDAIREYFMRIKGEYDRSGISWNKILDSCNYTLPRWQR